MDPGGTGPTAPPYILTQGATDQPRIEQALSGIAIRLEETQTDVRSPTPAVVEPLSTFVQENDRFKSNPYPSLFTMGCGTTVRDIIRGHFLFLNCGGIFCGGGGGDDCRGRITKG